MSNTKKNNENQLLKGTIIYAVGNFGTKILAFLIVPLYTYYISPSDMGEYELIQSTITFLIPVITLRISDAAYRWLLHDLAPKRDCISATYRAVLGGTLISATIIFLINLFIPIKYCGYFLALLVLGRWLESLQTLLRGLKKQRLFAISGVIFTAIYLAINVVLIVVVRMGVEALFVGTICSQIITIGIILFSTPELRTRQIGTRENINLTKEMIKYSAPLVPSGFSWSIMGVSDRYIIQYFLGSASTGLYSVANKFPSIISTLFVIFNNSWTDVAIGNLSEGEETEQYSTKLFRELYKISFCFTFFLIPLTKIVTETILSDAYKSSSTYISFLYLGAVFQGFTTFVSAGMLQGTKTGTIAKSSIIGAAVNVAIDFLWINNLGIYAASISTFAGFFIMWLIRMFDTQKVAPIHVNVLEFGSLFVTDLLIAITSIWSSRNVDIILTVVGIIVFYLINQRIVNTLTHRVMARFLR